ncbi:hypothetical protein ACP3V7_25060, partial [Salmonella enterica]|uniref:hypothetical protein n=1 Tax=Salmonella enterica TaxID=28901 RepID=UPI003CF207EE
TESFDGHETDRDIFFDDSDHWAKAQYPQPFSINSNNNLEKKEFYAILAACRKKLKAIQDAVFSLKYLDGMDSET